MSFFRSPVSDEAAVAAARLLLAYHEQQYRHAMLEVIADYHSDMIQRLHFDVVNIPKRTVAAREMARALREATG